MNIEQAEHRWVPYIDYCSFCKKVRTTDCDENWIRTCCSCSNKQYYEKLIRWEIKEIKLYMDNPIDKEIYNFYLQKKSWTQPN